MAEFMYRSGSDAGTGGAVGASAPPPQVLEEQLTLFQLGGGRFCPTLNTGTRNFIYLSVSLRWFRGRGPSIKRSHSSARQLSQCYYRGQVKVMDYIQGERGGFRRQKKYV